MEFAYDHRICNAFGGANVLLKRLIKSKQLNNQVGRVVRDGKVTTKFIPTPHWRIAINVPSKEKDMLLRLTNLDYFGKGKSGKRNAASATASSSGSGANANANGGSSSGGPVCRLCKQGSTLLKPLLKPCFCRGKKATVRIKIEKMKFSSCTL